MKHEIHDQAIPVVRRAGDCLPVVLPWVNKENERNETMKNVYLAGPMSSIPGFNHNEFRRIAGILRWNVNINVLSPAEIDNGSTDKPRSFYMREAIKLLMQADEVTLLEGWEKSDGARLEVAIAKELGLPVYDPLGNLLNSTFEDIPKPKIKQESICQEADRLVSDDRMEEYGHPKDDFDRQAALWTALFSDILAPNCKFNAADIPKAMILVKLSRLMNGYKRDSATDIAGYAKTLDMVETHEDEE